MPYEYEKNGAAIYLESFATIRSEANLARFDSDEEMVAVRMIHAAGMVGLEEHIHFSPNFVTSARTALENGAPIFCDARMVSEGVTRTRLPADNEVICTLWADGIKEMAAEMGNTRSAAALELWRPHLEGAVVAIGNAPTALFHLLERLHDGWPRPAAILAFPVGFVGAAESKDALMRAGLGIPYITLPGRDGGSALAAAAVNGLSVACENGEPV